MLIVEEILKLLKKWMHKPVVGILIRALIRQQANKEAKSIARHFAQYLEPKLAGDSDAKNSCFGIRHKVYCEELKFEPEKDDKLEMDDFDSHALHCLIQHKATESYAGTVRVVYSKSESQLLPLEKYCLDSINHPTLSPQNFPREQICEISRLAVPAEFRRRQTDKFGGAATGVINESTYSEQELRCFPFIAVGLYLSAASILLKHGMVHCFVMMEPRLARSLSFVGIQFEQIGPVVDYHGKRAPYYIDPNSLFETLSPGFKLLFKSIRQQLGVDR